MVYYDLSRGYLSSQKCLTQRKNVGNSDVEPQNERGERKKRVVVKFVVH